MLYEGKIIDPFYGDNYPKVKWISELTVKYSKNFTIAENSDILDKDNSVLTFEGIDTYSSVTLNGEHILKTENAFRRYRVDVRNLLRKGDNVIEVTIFSASSFDM